jgi:hypothetical protein
MVAAAASNTAAYATSQPCANPEVVPVRGVELYRCGSAWYRQAYGPAGPTFVAVRPLLGP